MPPCWAVQSAGSGHRTGAAPQGGPEAPQAGVLWEDTTLTPAETAARLAALGLDCTGVHFTPLPAAKHIFTHIEWHQSGYFLTVPEQPAPAGCVWAGKEQLEAAYTLPGAFKVYKKLLLTKLL